MIGDQRVNLVVGEGLAKALRHCERLDLAMAAARSLDHLGRFQAATDPSHFIGANPVFMSKQSFDENCPCGIELRDTYPASTEVLRLCDARVNTHINAGMSEHTGQCHRQANKPLVPGSPQPSIGSKRNLRDIE